MLVLALTVFIDFVAFGIFIPDLQLRGRELGADGLRLGMIQGLFSIAQVIFAPLLGRLSDIYGRKTVILFTSFVSAISYVMYAFSTSLWILGLSRFVCGIGGANVGVAFAFASDVTDDDNRSAGLGLVGAALGLGFVFGPAIGGILLKIGHDSPVLLGLVGAIISFSNFGLAALILPNLKPKQSTNKHENAFQTARRAFQDPRLRILLLMFFTLTLAFVNLESTFFSVLADKRSIYHLTDAVARSTGTVILSIIGVVSIIIQGGVVRRMSGKVSEVKVLKYAYLGYAPCILLIPFAPLWVPMVLVSVVLAVCSSLSQPNLSSLISKSAPEDLRGSVFGINQGAGAVARIFGPLLSNVLFDFRYWSPYALGAIVVLFPITMAWSLKEDHAVSSPQPAVEAA